MMLVPALWLAPFLAPGHATPAPPPQPASPPPVSSTPEPSPSPGPPPPSPAPTASPAPGPSASPSPGPAAPTPTTPSYRYVYTPRPTQTPPAPDAPRIVEVDFTDETIHENSDVALRILTSPAVSSVVLSALGHDVPVPQLGAGVWGARMHVPAVPFFMLRTYNVQVRAATADGRADSVTLPVRLVR